MILLVGVSVGEEADPTGLAGDSGTAGLTGMVWGWLRWPISWAAAVWEAEPISAEHSVAYLAP